MRIICGEGIGCRARRRVLKLVRAPVKGSVAYGELLIEKVLRPMNKKQVSRIRKILKV